MFSHNKDFYPTPAHVIAMMGFDCFEKVVLEPQAGKGDIVQWCKDHNAKEVLACEIHPDLAEIVKTKAKFLRHDFLTLTREEISHVQMIIMNPPFSTGVKHILHAWEIAPDGCEIYSLVNYANLDNRTIKTEELNAIIKGYGSDQSLGDVFGQGAERDTNVSVGLIKLYKPQTGSNEFQGFFLDEDKPETSTGPGIMPYNSVRDVVQRYIDSVKIFEEFEGLKTRMDSATRLFDVGTFSFNVGRSKRNGDQVQVFKKEDFKKELQKKAWEYLFTKMNMEKYVTRGVMENINKFVEQQTAVPFTMRNVYKMFDVIFGTRQESFNRSLVEVIDRYTKHTHENRYALEGWKTNAGHLLNKTFIVPYMIEDGKFYRDKMRLKSGSYEEGMDDLMKVLCSLTGQDFDNFVRLRVHVGYQYHIYSGDKYIYSDYKKDWNYNAELKKLYEDGQPIREEDLKPEFGKWFDWGFFQCRGYKKGTMHFKFKDPKVWELLNRKYAEIKGQVLPEKI